MQIDRKFREIREIPLPWPLYEEIYQRPWDTRPQILTLEKGIEKLVRVINGFGMQTTGSCEGHLKTHPHPWIQIAGLQYPDFWVRGIVDELTDEYGRNKGADRPAWFVHQWSQSEAWLRTREIATCNEELLRLRQGADDFAQYLFDTRLRVNG